MITIQIRLFAGQREIVGSTALPMPLPEGATVQTAWEQLTASYPRLAGYTGRMLYALNQEYATLASVLRDGDELAFIPPVSGGL